jgi:GDP-D-mannose dehydratase
LKLSKRHIAKTVSWRVIGTTDTLILSLNITKIIQICQPDEIYNLGAMSHVKVSFDVPAQFKQVNF